MHPIGRRLTDDELTEAAHQHRTVRERNIVGALIDSWTCKACRDRSTDPAWRCTVGAMAAELQQARALPGKG